MAKILSVPERIKLFREINRVHKEIYGWRLVYRNVWGKAGYIDIERNAREIPNGWVSMNNTEAMGFYFNNDMGKTITSLQGLFSWQVYYFYHVNPYKFHEYYSIKPPERLNLNEDDIISDTLGRRITPVTLF